MPAAIVGTIFGVILNVVLPQWFEIVAFMIMLLLLIIAMARKVISRSVVFHSIFAVCIL